MRRRGESNDRGSHAGVRECERHGGCSRPWEVGSGWIVLGRRAALGCCRDAGGDDKRSVGSLERRTHGFDRLAVGFVGSRVALEVVDEREMDDAVALVRAFAQGVEFLERPAVHFGTGRRERIGGRVGPRQTDDVMTGVDQFGDDGGADPTRCAGDEDAHEQTSERSGDPGPQRGERARERPAPDRRLDEERDGRHDRHGGGRP